MDDIQLYLLMNEGNVNRLIWEVMNHPYKRSMNNLKETVKDNSERYYNSTFLGKENGGVLEMDLMVLLKRVDYLGLLH